MRDEEPDYTTYSLPDLTDAQRHINRQEFPERAARLDAEIAKRSAVRPAPAVGSGSSASGCAQYALAFCSFVPLVGIFIAIVTTVVAFVGPRHLRKVMIGIALGGLLFNGLLYGGLFYFGLYRPVGPYRTMHDEIIQDQLAQLVRDLEYCKLQTGHYPQDLQELQSVVPKAFIYDTSRMQMQLQPFYFQLRDGGSGYYLFSVGPDGRPFTSDDLLPRLPEEQRSRTGLRLPGPM